MKQEKWGEGEMRRRVGKGLKTERYIGTGPFMPSLPHKRVRPLHRARYGPAKQSIFKICTLPPFYNAELYSCAALPLRKKSLCICVGAARCATEIECNKRSGISIQRSIVARVRVCTSSKETRLSSALWMTMIVCI